MAATTHGLVLFHVCLGGGGGGTFGNWNLCSADLLGEEAKIFYTIAWESANNYEDVKYVLQSQTDFRQTNF